MQLYHCSAPFLLWGVGSLGPWSSVPTSNSVQEIAQSYLEDENEQGWERIMNSSMSSLEEEGWGKMVVNEMHLSHQTSLSDHFFLLYWSVSPLVFHYRKMGNTLLQRRHLIKNSLGNILHKCIVFGSQTSNVVSLADYFVFLPPVVKITCWVRQKMFQEGVKLTISREIDDGF